MTLSGRDLVLVRAAGQTGPVASSAADTRNQTKASIAYAHALRGLDSQVAVIAELRARANAMMVATAGSISLFGGFVLKSESAHHWVNAFAVVPLLLGMYGLWDALAVLRPTGKQGEPGALQLVASASSILGIPGPQDEPIEAMIAIALEDMWDQNQVEVESLLQRLRNSTACLAAQLASWTLLLTFKEVL